jgi:hypothetical protein
MFHFSFFDQDPQNNIEYDFGYLDGTTIIFPLQWQLTTQKLLDNQISLSTIHPKKKKTYRWEGGM